MSDQPMVQVIVSDGQLRRQTNFLVGNGLRSRIAFKVRGDVSAQKYQSIVSALQEENQQRGRNDFILNERQPPYQPFPSVRINGVPALENTVQQRGTSFICVIGPTEWNAYQAIASRASQLGVEVDTWTED